MSPVSRTGPIEPLAQESTPSMIAARVRDAIARGDIPPGSQLGEAAYARQLGVSRGPLREGLQRLTQEGLLISIRNRGLFVIEMTPENVTDIYLAREAVERAAATQVHRLDASQAAAEMLRATEQMARAAASGNTEAFTDADLSFHRILVARSRSPRLERIHDTLLTETRMCIRALADTYTVAETRVGEHAAIARSFTAGDPELTDRLLVAHMQDAIERLTPAPSNSGTEV